MDPLSCSRILFSISCCVCGCLFPFSLYTSFCRCNCVLMCRRWAERPLLLSAGFLASSLPSVNPSVSLTTTQLLCRSRLFTGMLAENAINEAQLKHHPCRSAYRAQAHNTCKTTFQIMVPSCTLFKQSSYYYYYNNDPSLLPLIWVTLLIFGMNSSYCCIFLLPSIWPASFTLYHAGYAASDTATSLSTGFLRFCRGTVFFCFFSDWTD